MSERKRLSDLFVGGAEKMADAWDKTAPAEGFKPLPPGEYDATIIQGELFTARTGTPGYKLTFEVSGGEHAGRRFWCDLWLTDRAIRFTKGELLKLGITKFEQLDRPLPARFLCKAKLALRQNDDGTEWNRVRSFEVLRAEEVERFAPPGDVAA
jgi:hypothetical protein